MALFEIKGLSFSYPEREEKALDNINLNIYNGEFIVVCGRSGCGKSTLLRHLKPVLTPHGTKEGEILFRGRNLWKLDLREQASKIGYVHQNPDNQIVTDKVWHELAFGLESLGYDNKTIILRVAEMASFFGIQEWFMKSVTQLSGGQKQLLNLASIMNMNPSVLILDEPTSQLDPIAASEFLEVVRKINRELGTTVIISEHRLEEVFPMADKVLVLDNGEAILYDEPVNVGEKLKKLNHNMFVSMPSVMQIYAGVDSDLPCPLTVRDGRRFLDMLGLDIPGSSDLSDPTDNTDPTDLTEPADPSSISGSYKRRDIGMDKYYGSNRGTIISFKDVWFRYDKKDKDVIKDLSFDVQKGTIHSILGGNGTGKTTTLKLLVGINKPYRGRIKLNGKPIGKYSNEELFKSNLALLPQDPQALFVKSTVKDDLLEVLNYQKLTKDEKEKKISDITELVEISHLLDMHPYDLSGGEQQRAALAKVLLLEPKVLLLDEPTKGIDNFFKIKLAKILESLTSLGVTVLLVSHDIEFCARYAHVCSLFFDGNIVTTNTPEKFFSCNSFYTTAANRMARHLMPGAITNEDVINFCNQYRRVPSLETVGLP